MAKKRRGRNLPVTASDREIVKMLSDAELSFMIRNTSGAAKKLFLKEAGRRVAEEMKSSARKNPPIITTGSKRKMHGSAAHMIGIAVYEIRYRHAADGRDYKHPFETGDVMMLGMPDGSLKIESATGKRLWENFDV